ncbi:MAG: hypothetical protein K0Q95_2199 [Bacteroidota bacterium]|jgi:hypothetical protein|nr:hypothetical protein [Bacteroidota bacterium]
MKRSYSAVAFTLVTFCFLLFNNLSAQLPGFNWAHSYQGDIGNVIVNSNNDIYFLEGSVLRKKSATGTILWSSTQTYSTIALDKNQNVIGTRATALDKHSPTGVVTTYPITLTGANASFNFLNSSCIDTLNNLYVLATYQVQSSLSYLNGISLGTYFTSGSGGGGLMENYRVGVFKFNAAGVYQGPVWNDSQQSIYSYKLKTGSNGTVYLAISYNTNPSGNATYSNFFELKSLNNGNVWVNEWLTSANLRVGMYDIDIDFDSFNNIILATDFSCNTSYSFGPTSLTSIGSTDVVLLKYDINGNRIIAKNFGSTSVENGAAIEIDNSNNIYFSGFYGSGNTNLTIGTQVLAFQGNGDAFLAKLSSNFNLQWVKPYANYGIERVNEIEIDALGNVIVAGSFNTGTFSVETENFTNMGGTDGMMIKYCTGTPAAISSLPKACINTTALTLTGGTPLGGSYTGIAVSSNVFNPSIVGLGTYAITYTYTDGNGCKNFDIDSITVYPQPNVTLSSFPDKCANASAFSLSGGFPSGGTYSGTGVSSNVFNPATSGVGTFPVSYTYTNGNGCSNSTSKPLTVNSLPAITFNAFANVCQGTSTVALNGALPSGGTYSGNGVFSNIFYPSAAGVGVGSHTITYSYQDANNCINTASQPITVTPLPVATLTVTNESYVGACDGSVTTVISGGSGSINTIWTNSSSSVIGFTASISNLCPGNYTLTLTDNAGCTKTYPVNIAAGPLPPAVPICLVTVDSFSNHNIVVWEKPASTLIDSFRIYRETGTGIYTQIGSVHYDSLSLYHDYFANPNVTSFKYKISSVDAASNESPLSLAHKTIHLIVNGGGTQQNLQWNDYEGASIQYYQVWRDNLGNGAWQVLSSTIPASSGVVTWSDLTPSSNPNARYYLDVIWTNGCDPTRATVNTTRSNIKNSSLATANGIAETEQLLSAVILPNPASDRITVNVSNMASEYSISVYSVVGELVYEANSLSSPEHLINTESFAKGVFMVSVKTQNKTIFKKLVIQ